MTARVLAYLSSLLPLRSGRIGIPPPESINFVLHEFDKLDLEAQQKVARDLAELWNSFIKSFGSVEGFLTGDEVSRSDYLQRIETVARRMSSAKGSEKAHYYFATTMIAHYLRALHEGVAEIENQRLASRVASLIDEGRSLLLRAPNGEPGTAH